jgi:hypothetical protein
MLAGELQKGSMSPSHQRHYGDVVVSYVGNGKKAIRIQSSTCRPEFRVLYGIL